MEMLPLFRSAFSYRSRSPLFGGSRLVSRLALDFIRNLRLPLVSPAPPRLIQIEPVSLCNRDCCMCVRTQEKREQGQMPLAAFQKIVAENFPYPHWTLLYGQGEPFLNPDLISMIGFEREKGNFVTTVTNGSLLNEKINREIIASRLSTLRISLDASTEETFRRVGRGSDFHQVVDNLKHLSLAIREAGTGPELSFSFMVMPENLEDLPGLVELASRNSVRLIDVKEVPPYTDSPRPSLSVEIRKDPELEREIGRVFRSVKETGKRRGVRVILPPLEPDPRKICLNPWFKTFITWDGRVSPCSRYFSPGNYFCGQITDRAFREIWTGEKYQKIRAALRQGKPEPGMRSCFKKIPCVQPEHP